MQVRPPKVNALPMLVLMATLPMLCMLPVRCKVDCCNVFGFRGWVGNERLRMCDGKGLGVSLVKCGSVRA